LAAIAKEEARFECVLAVPSARALPARRRGYPTTVASALLIVDVQNDFTPGGALPVPHGDEIIDNVNELAASDAFDVVIATRDWHPPDHHSFEDQGGQWPPHCVAGSEGAQLDKRLDTRHIDAVIDKGQSPETEGYSGFQDTQLAQLLREERVSAVAVVGLATEYCVRSTALDALSEGLSVTVHTDAIRGIDPDDSQRALDELLAAGAVVED